MDKSQVSAVKEILAASVKPDAPVVDEHGNPATPVLDADGNPVVIDEGGEVDVVTPEKQAEIDAAAALEEEGAAGEEDDDETDGADASAGDDASDVYTVDSFAEAIGWETEDLYNGVVVGMGDNEKPVLLGELKDLYQATVRERDELNTKLESQTGELNTVRDLTNTGHGVSQEMMSAFSYLDSLKAQYEGINWQEREAADSGDAALLRQKFQDAFQNGQKAVDVAQDNMNKYRQQTLQRAAGRMFEIIPEWNQKPEVMKADQGHIRTMMISEGYSHDEINGIADPRNMKLLRELVMLRAEKAGAVTALKKVRKAPKILKPGARVAKVKTSVSVKDAKDAVTKATPSGRRKAEENAVKAIIKNAAQQQRTG